MFKVKALAVLLPPFPCEMKTNTAKFKSTAILSLACFYENGATLSHARGLSMRTHLTAVTWALPGRTTEVHGSRTFRHSAHAQSQV